jgi:hypothetical protein
MANIADHFRLSLFYIKGLCLLCFKLLSCLVIKAHYLFLLLPEFIHLLQVLFLLVLKLIQLVSLSIGLLYLLASLSLELHQLLFLLLKLLSCHCEVIFGLL